MFRWIVTIVVLFAAACGGSPKRGDKPPLITRQAEPMVPRPARTSAVRFTVEPAVEALVEEMLASEASSNEIVSVTGLRWADGRQTVVVAHVRYPQQDMNESALEAAVDEARLSDCDTQYQDCAEGLESCREDAYEACIRASYRDPYVYMSTHLGMECGTMELSSFTLEGNGASLHDRRTLELMLCDYDASAVPAAADLDGDGGPELVYTWASSRAADWRDETMRETVIIVDGNDLREQFRLEQDSADYDEEQSVMGLTTDDTDGDGFPDLVSSIVDRQGYCGGYGWALDGRFVIPNDQAPDDEACRIVIQQQTYPYDPTRDSWMPAEGEP